MGQGTISSVLKKKQMHMKGDKVGEYETEDCIGQCCGT